MPNDEEHQAAPVAVPEVVVKPGDGPPRRRSHGRVLLRPRPCRRVGVGRWRLLFGENSHGGTAKYPTANQTRRTPGENPDEGATVVREARWEQRGLDKEIGTPVQEPQAVSKSRPEEIPDVKSDRMVQRQICRSLFSLQVQPSLLIPCSGIRLQRKHNQNKRLFAPPLRRFLNYRVGPPGLCACARKHSPASCSEVRGQNARRGAIADTSQLKKCIKP